MIVFGRNGITMPELPQPMSHTVDAIYRSYEGKLRYERSYLGASTFGTECDRAFWYGFRHAYEPECFDGRKLRLFQTGHREEERLIEDLRAAGLEVQETDPASGGQWAISAIGGHMRGHLDGLVWGLPEAPRAEHVLETKTHNEKSFRALVKNKVEKSKPGHYAQMQIYMHFKGVGRALYLAMNKNTDELYAERVHYDMATAARLIVRAERTIQADVAPAKLHEDPNERAAFACGWCAAFNICHGGQMARVNCRTCLSSTPVVDASDRGAWWCELHQKELSFANQQAGCAQHLYLPSLVPGEQVDASERDRTVSYKMPDGSVWVDGAGKGTNK
jgi:hypothetical protein